MYYEFYIDRFFAEQFLTDYLLLNAAAIFCREKGSGWRLMAGSLTGAAIMTGALLLGKPDLGLTGLAAASAAAFWRRNLKKQWKHNVFCTVSVLFLTLCFGGALELFVSFAGLPFLFAAAVSFAFLRAVLRFLGRRQRETEHLAVVTLTLEGRTVRLQALIDTGNRLRAPLTGRPVSVVEQSAAEALLQEGYLERKGFCLIPYHSLGIGTGWMKGIAPDEMTVSTSEDTREVKAPLVALYEGKVSAAGDWQMILHPEHIP